MNAFLLLATVFRCAFGPGTASDPSAVIPPELAAEPVAFWYDETAFHAGGSAFPWKRLGVLPKDGASFKVPLVASTGEKVELEARLDASAPRLYIDSFGFFGNSAVTNRIGVRAARTARYMVQFYASGMTPDFANDYTSAEVTAGERGSVPVNSRAPSSGDYELRVFADGVDYCFVSGLFHDPRLKFDFKYIWTAPEKNTMYVRTAGWARSGYEMRVTMRDLETDGNGRWTKTAAVGDIDGEREYPFDVSDLESGFYWAHVDYLDREGKIVHSDKTRYFKPFAKMPWKDRALGEEDTVPPPWTEPRFDEDGTFICWNRTVKLGGKGLVSSIVNAGQEMLVDPVGIVRDGRPLAFDVVKVERRRSSADYTLRAKDGGVEAHVFCDFDGFLKFDVTYPTPVGSLAWRVPVRRDRVVGFDDCSSEGNAEVRFPATGRVERRCNPDAKPNWWLPGRIGLLGGVLNLHGTHLKDVWNAVTAVADGDALTVTTRFVDEPLAEKGRRTVSFYLEPTPAKPKNLALASLDSKRLIGWTGYMCQFYESQYPGFGAPERIDPYRAEVRRGKRVFFYNGTRGFSPEHPFWNWYRRDWNLYGIDYFSHEAPLTTPYKRQHNNWVDCCLFDRDFFEYKIHGVNWYLHEAAPEMKDLYFDLANPKQCYNETHACVWKDDFGRTMRDWSTLPLREIHKRAYRLVKAKNLDGALYGHVGCKRYPGDVFFDLICTGESLADRVMANGYTYYDVYTPELFQSYFVPRAEELVVLIDAQLVRARECWAPDLYRTYDPSEPENLRAIRHAIAYIDIHDATSGMPSEGKQGPCYYKVDAAIQALGPTRRHTAYYHKDTKDVTVSDPHPRFLWSWHRNGSDGVLIVLNDTDAAVEEEVVLTGVRGVGEEILDGTTYDFSSGRCRFQLGPREARFVHIRFAGRREISLDGPGWTCDGESVCVPHTWNATDACDGPGDKITDWTGYNGGDSVGGKGYLRKRAVYRRALPAKREGRRYFLKFDGASVRAEVSVNGRTVGAHDGAFTAFAFEVTDFLWFGGESQLEVAVDNRWRETTQPMSADYSVYGGLYRGVRLIDTDRVCIDPVTDGADGVKVETDAKTGEVTVLVSVLGGTNEVQRFKVAKHELWSPERPKLYTRRIAIEQGGAVDAVDVRFAFRTMEFRDGRFYLNGKCRQLKGVNRHQDRQGKGWAVSAEDEESDIRLMKEMGAEALRTAHYPQSRHVYDLCDELGLVCWAEYPNVNRLTFSETFERGMRRQVREMLAQLRNHPCIGMWGIFNELYNGEEWMESHSAEVLAMMRRTRDFIHGLDPSRAVVGVMGEVNMKPLNAIPDEFGVNVYPKWYSNLTMREMLDEQLAGTGRRTFAVSEYGVGASVRHHGDPAERPRTDAMWHPEEYQAYRMHDNLRVLMSEPRVWGHYVWAMFDFGADNRREGDRHGINDKGLVAFDHVTRKDAFYLFQANWRKDVKVLHLVGRRMTEVKADRISVLGFSNVGPVELWVNGHSLGVRVPDEACGVVWPKVPLRPGDNEISLRAGGLMSTARWTRR